MMSIYQVPELKNTEETLKNSMISHFCRRRRRKPGEEEDEEEKKSAQQQQLDLKDQWHRGNVDSESPDFDLNTEEAEVISKSPESLKEEIQESREQQERLNNF